MKGLDYSGPSTNWNAVSLAAHQDMARDGFRIAQVGLWTGEQAYTSGHDSLWNARRAGLLTAAYTAVTPSHSGRDSVGIAAMAAAEEWPLLKFVAVDAEIANVSLDEIANAIDEVRIRGQRPVLYTANWCWTGFFGNSFRFHDVPLQNAYYDGNPDIDFLKAPFGSWGIADVMGEQYTDTQNAYGIGIDLDFFRDEFVTALDGPPVSGPTEASSVPPLVALGQAWEKDMADLAMGAASLIPTHLDTVRLALHAIYTAKRTEAWKALVMPGGSPGGK